MYKVVMEYENIDKYFSLGILIENNKLVIVPKTKEIFLYMKNISSYGGNKFNKYEEVIFNAFDNFTEYSDNKIELNTFVFFTKFEEIVFEFETEEEAFYFKMKYC